MANIFVKIGKDIELGAEDLLKWITKGATVTAINTRTGVRSVIQTDGKGFYNFPNLPVGTYDLQVVQKGFKLRTKKGIVVEANAAIREDVKLELGEVTPAGGDTVRREIKLTQGLSTEKAKAIVKAIKDQKFKKAQASIQGDEVRVQAPSRDELQAVITFLRTQDFGLELKFGNYRG